MKIVVTGSGGQVGQEFEHIKKILFNDIHSNHDIVCFNRNDLDITDLKKVEFLIAKESPQLLINCAAYTAVDKAEIDPESAFKINDEGARNIAIVCQKIGIALIHISSDYVFSGDNKNAYIETDITNPSSVYGASKLAGEIAIREVLKEHIILRTAWVFGEYGNNFVKKMLNLGAKQEKISVVGDQYGAPTSAEGIANCCIEIANQLKIRSKNEDRWGIYHFSGSSYTNWHDFAVEIYKQAVETNLYYKPPIVDKVTSDIFTTSTKRPANSRLDCNKLLLAFNIPADDWKKKLSLIVNSFLNY